MLIQIFFGSCLLVSCALIHVVIVASGIPMLKNMGQYGGPQHRYRRIGFLLGAGTGVLILAHSVQIWLWAASFAYLNEFEEFSTSFYFATVTYTTLGYGDLVLGESTRIFASFCAITGLLTFGISTAFLIGLLGRTMPNVFDPD